MFSVFLRVCGLKRGGNFVTSHFKHALGILIATLFALVANIGFSQPTNVAPKTRVGVLVDNYPFSFRGTDGRIQGFAYELLQEVEKVMGLRFERIEGTTKEINAAFQEGRIDLLQSFARSPEREATAEFSVPYLTMSGQVFVREGGLDIKTLAELKGRKVMVHRGSLGEQFLQRAGLQESIVYVESVEQALVRLDRGEVDATLATRLTGLSLAHRLELKHLRVLEMEIEGFNVDYCVAVQKGNYAHLSRINEGIALLVRTGKFDELYRKWFGFVTPTGYTREQILLATAVGLALALGVAMWAVGRQRALRRQISVRTESLRTSEAGLAAAQAQAHLGSWEMDLASEKITWSAEMFRLHYQDLARPAPSFAGFLELVHPDDRERIQSVKARLLEIKAAVGSEHRTHPALGPVRHLLSTYQVVCDDAGTQRKVVGTTLDVTERKLSELARERSLSLMLATLESTADGILVVNSEGKIETFNRVFARMWRLPDDVLASKDDARALQCVLDQLSEPQKFIDKVTHLYQHPEEESFDDLEFKDGRVFERYSRPQFISGQVVGRVWSFRDVTERKVAEARIQYLNRIYAVLSDINQNIVREKNPLAMLAAACQIAVEKGQFRMAWIGLVDESSGRIKVVAHAGAKSDVLHILQALLEDKSQTCGCSFTLHALQTGGHGVCNDIARDPQAVVWRSAALEQGYHAMASLPLKAETKVIGTFNLYAGEVGFFDAEELRLLDELAMDISFALKVSEREDERLRAEEELRISGQQLRALTARLETLREEERIHISREIHDELGQKLTGLKMDLHWLENRLPQIGDEKLRAALEEKIITATTTADETMVTVQRIAAELRPAMLDSLGLITTLRYEAKQFEGRTNIPVTMNLPAGAVNLNSAVATTAYRIFQEVLTNVARHAQATKVQVSLEVSDGKLRLQVEDNGVGVSPDDLLNPRSLGLLGMKERAAMLNGSVRVEGAPGQGTIVRLEISVENPAASAKQSQG
ncbi:MAG: transporter substrate-binding domain-containing protein [Verrucomicrobiota bacterium]